MTSEFARLIPPSLYNTFLVISLNSSKLYGWICNMANLVSNGGKRVSVLFDAANTDVFNWVCLVLYVWFQIKFLLPLSSKE
jgi:hypothetical protein